MNRGGIETMLMNYLRYIDRSQVQFDFLLTGDRHFEYESEIKDLGGKIYRIPRLGYKSFPSFIAGLNRFFKEHNYYPIVHSHWNAFNGLVLFFAKLHGVQCRISHSHIAKKSSGIYGLLQILLKRIIKYTATINVSCGEEAALFLYGKKEYKIGNYVIFNNSIEVDKFRYSSSTRIQLRKKLGIAPNTVVMGHIGRFMKQKNHRFILSIFDEFLKIKNDCKLLLIGEGPLEEELKRKVNLLNIEEKVIFMGVIPNVNDYLQVMDIFIFPSLYEGLSLSIIEAQAAGLPVVASKSIDPHSKVSPLVEFVSLKEKPTVWASVVYSKLKHQNRENYYRYIVDADYDVKNSAQKLQKYYISLLYKNG